ncbi:MAG: hypothetical protein NUV70_01615 [Caldiserica bacterium]|jgi:hypothetical protein|nr:hypothetical protein [Caldisericota bacterium]
MAFRKTVFFLALPALLGAILLFSPFPGSAQDRGLEERSSLAQTEGSSTLGDTSQIQPLAQEMDTLSPDQGEITPLLSTNPCQGCQNLGECGNPASQTVSGTVFEQCEHVRARERVATENCEQIQIRERVTQENRALKATDTPSTPKGVHAAIDLPEETVEALRSQGLGYGEIVIIQELAEQSGKTVDEIVALFQEGYGWGETASLLGVDFHGIGEIVSQGQKSTQRGK